MKKLITICLVLCIASLSLASVVAPPPGAPGWWNSEDGLYAYGWWSTDIIGGSPIISPPDNAIHWASNYLDNDDFTASIGITNGTVALTLGNEFHADLFKKIYVYITGTTVSTEKPVDTVLNTDGGTFTGTQSWSINENGIWSYVLTGEITPQPAYVWLTFAVPGMTNVTNIWAGEVCVPEPATIALLCLGALSLIRRKE